MTQEELAEAIDRAVGGFSSLEGVEVELAERLVEEGFLSYDDLSVIEPDALMAMGDLSEEAANVIVEQAEERAEAGRSGGRRSAAPEARARTAGRNGGRSRHEAGAGGRRSGEEPASQPRRRTKPRAKSPRSCDEEADDDGCRRRRSDSGDDRPSEQTEQLDEPTESSQRNVEHAR